MAAEAVAGLNLSNVVLAPQLVAGPPVTPSGGVCACEHGWRGPHCATSDVLARNAMLAEVGLLGE